MITGVVVNFSFNVSNACKQSLEKSNGASFINKLQIGLAILEVPDKSLIKSCMSYELLMPFTFVGGSFAMVSIFA